MTADAGDRKRKRPRGQALWRATLLAALAAAIALFLRFGGWGIGLGGSGRGSGDGSGHAGSAATQPARCELKLTAKGIFVDGKPSTRDAAIEACKSGGANVIVTGDALHGDWVDLEQALQSAHVVYFRRGD